MNWLFQPSDLNNYFVIFFLTGQNVLLLSSRRSPELYIYRRPHSKGDHSYVQTINFDEPSNLATSTQLIPFPSKYKDAPAKMLLGEKDSEKNDGSNKKGRKNKKNKKKSSLSPQRRLVSMQIGTFEGDPVLNLLLTAKSPSGDLKAYHVQIRDLMFLKPFLDSHVKKIAEKAGCVVSPILELSTAGVEQKESNREVEKNSDDPLSEPLSPGFPRSTSDFPYSDIGEGVSEPALRADSVGPIGSGMGGKTLFEDSNIPFLGGIGNKSNGPNPLKIGEIFSNLRNDEITTLKLSPLSDETDNHPFLNEKNVFFETSEDDDIVGLDDALEQDKPLAGPVAIDSNSNNETIPKPAEKSVSFDQMEKQPVTESGTQELATLEPGTSPSNSLSSTAITPTVSMGISTPVSNEDPIPSNTQKQVQVQSNQQPSQQVPVVAPTQNAFQYQRMAPVVRPPNPRPPRHGPPPNPSQFVQQPNFALQQGAIAPPRPMMFPQQIGTSAFPLPPRGPSSFFHQQQLMVQQQIIQQVAAQQSQERKQLLFQQQQQVTEQELAETQQKMQQAQEEQKRLVLEQEQAQAQQQQQQQQKQHQQSIFDPFSGMDDFYNDEGFDWGAVSEMMRTRDITDAEVVEDNNNDNNNSNNNTSDDSDDVIGNPFFSFVCKELSHKYPELSH
eukprot:TRINITY_DN4720_c1_g3_i2.p1 TRINITY_DN4720_c1_g3~~TRINITY_DN4720_c1_g3_i2.p1  ORF type:complete len:667 (-),score=247.63 TRINITY_DN4720_c1_g3_i2:5-2005(-)